MKTLIISKPVYDFIMPLVEFPQDGDKFYIDNSINTLSNIGTLCAITLSKYGVDVSYTGMVGEDYIGNKIKEILSECKIDISYIETSYTEHTCTSHKIYNQKTNKFTSIEENSLKTNLTKYKYEFIPDVIIMDDKDYPANLAAINNYPNSKLIFVGEKYTKESSVYCNKCKYVICNLKFASDATGVINDLNKQKNIVVLFQKYIDIYNSNLIIRLDNFDILYCVDDEVRLIKNINKNIINKENVYYSILCYFLSNNIDVENSIKLTNKVMLSSNSELDMIKNIPDYSIINKSMEDYKRQINSTNITTNNVQQTNNIIQNKIEDNNIQNNIIQNNQTQNNLETTNSNLQSIDTPTLNNNQNTVNNNGVNNVERL